MFDYNLICMLRYEVFQVCGTIDLIFSLNSLGVRFEINRSRSHHVPGHRNLKTANAISLPSFTSYAINMFHAHFRLGPPYDILPPVTFVLLMI